MDLSLIYKKLGFHEANVKRHWSGSFSEFYIIGSGAQNYFLKLSTHPEAYAQYKAETIGLRAIGESNTIQVPQIIGYGRLESNTAYLCMEYVDAVPFSTRTSEKLGYQLAALHRHSAEYYGWKENNFIAVLPQENRKCQNWIDFFIDQRLKIQFDLAAKQFSDGFLKCENLNLFYTNIRQTLIEEKPSLLHGDLWSGNILSDKKAAVYLIDPAVYYGHREVDIAMALLFGGFQSNFYNAYQEVFPLLPEWENRIPIYQLYYLLVHLNLFGRAYLNAVEGIVRKYV
jgi:fructosamine-3-kinase